MKYSDEELIERIPKHDLRAIARLITLSENGVRRARDVQGKLFEKTGRAHVIGVTGAPGAGKSTLVDQMARAWRAAGKKVAILAVDPTSPFSGGAILGDRIRMIKSSEDEGVYIRSMATRGALGGLSRATADAVQILDSGGFDIIIVETVGVGQAEVDIITTADTCLVVLVPGMGDSVQIIKAGIIEIADLFIINKADRDGADMLHKDLRVLISLGDHDESSWLPPIIQTVATSGNGTSDVLEHVAKHKAWYDTSEQGRQRRRRIVEQNLVKLVTETVFEKIIEGQPELLQKLIDECLSRKTDPYSATEQLIKGFSAD
jgi:LAO/AO transport system kinase